MPWQSLHTDIGVDGLGALVHRAASTAPKVFRWSWYIMPHEVLAALSEMVICTEEAFNLSPMRGEIT